MRSRSLPVLTAARTWLAVALSLPAVLTAASTSAPRVPPVISLSGKGTAQRKVPTAPLRAPKTSDVQDAEYFTDLAEVDQTLGNYMQSKGNLALKALITDGSAFCAFLAQGGGLDYAMVSVVVGARTVEGQTHLPSTVATFNAVDAVALLTLCPSEQRLVPGPVRARVRQLGSELKGRSS